MTSLLYTHPSFLAHDTGPAHPERADRLRAIAAALDEARFPALRRIEAPRGTLDQIRLVHLPEYVDHIFDLVPDSGHLYADSDTVLSPGSGEAALHAVGAVCAAVDAVCSGAAQNAFCAVRPPGHHAEPSHAMGFCLFNNVAIAAQYARSKYPISRVAIVDFDVHHGNGTQAVFYREPQVLYASTHQMPLYPGTGSARETGVGNIFNAPLPPGSGGEAFRAAMEEKIFPALRKFEPQLLLISAGFDAHRDDPLASLNLVEEDYAWVTRELLSIAKSYCEGRLVSVLEGGYDLNALGRSVAAHVGALQGD